MSFSSWTVMSTDVVARQVLDFITESYDKNSFIISFFREIRWSEFLDLNVVLFIKQNQRISDLSPEISACSPKIEILIGCSVAAKQFEFLTNQNRIAEFVLSCEFSAAYQKIWELMS